MKVSLLSVVSLRLFYFLFALALACYLPRRGFRKGSLSSWGALAAFVVGAVHMSCGLQYGITLIVFYLSSSKLTRLGAKRKAALEQGHEEEGGRRGAAQVLANSLAACVFATLSYIAATVLEPSRPRLGLPVPRVWMAGAFLGHYACCCGDTWASELGILSRAAPRLITTGRRVPPGTNGGVSPLGLACSVAGGLTTGLAFFAGGLAGCALGAAPRGGSLCPAPPDAGNDGGGAGDGRTWTLHDAALGGGPAGLPALASVGLACGLFGSLLDSLLGATLQYTGWDPQTGRVVAAASAPRAGGRRGGGGGDGVAQVQHVSGVPLLSNSGVNFVAAAATAALGAALLERW